MRPQSRTRLASKHIRNAKKNSSVTFCGKWVDKEWNISRFTVFIVHFFFWITLLLPLGVLFFHCRRFSILTYLIYFCDWDMILPISLITSCIAWNVVINCHSFLLRLKSIVLWSTLLFSHFSSVQFCIHDLHVLTIDTSEKICN